MSNEEVGYIAVQKKPAVTIFPDSIVVTNKRIILYKPKNLGLSMEFIDYDWDNIAGSFVKEGILADFTFTTNSDLTQTVDYLPKNQVLKLYTYAKEQLDLLKKPKVAAPVVEEVKVETPIETPVQEAEVEEIPTEEVTLYTEIMPTSNDIIRDTEVEAPISEEKGLAHLTQDELFAKLQNYKKLLDYGLILQGEYDRLKSEILKYL